MKLWNFTHGTLGMEVWVFLALVLLAVMAIVALVHHKKQTNREEDYAEELKKLSGTPESSPEDSPEKKEDAEA